MKATLALFFLALAASPVLADSKKQKDSKPASGKASKPSNSDSAPKVKADVWKPTTVKFSSGTFLEQFASPNVLKSNWAVSEAIKQKDVKSDEKDQDLYRYKGEWKVEEPTVLIGSKPGDYGLVLKTASAHHAVSKVFDKTIEFKGQKQITIQYEVKLQAGLECGGAYMKLLVKDKDFVAKAFTDGSPYSIMFGPDKCGSNNKVHFIFRYKNPKTGKTNEHHLKDAPVVPSTSDKMTHLYTLKVFPQDNKYEILIDNKSTKKGSLYDDFNPPVIPSKEIDDPEDKKPSDWVDQAKISDPEAKKPEDWNEDAPAEIEDMDAKKPEDWLEKEPEYVADPDAVKPEDWDDEEDGDWIPPKVANPKCAQVSGCGPWKRPMKKNPDYKGKWSAPLIDNPAYKGPWAPRKIPNPEFFEEKAVGQNFLPIGAIGFELWTLQSDILFDNILLTSDSDSVIEAFTAETFTPKHTKETELAKDAEPKDETTKDSAASFFANMMPLSEQFTTESLNKFMTKFHLKPLDIVKEMPALVASFIVVGFLLPVRLLMSLFKSSPPPKPQVTSVTKSPSRSSSAQSSPKKKAEKKDSDDVTDSGSDARSEEKKKAKKESEEDEE
ncbi:Calreticulin family-domain-containing protein [Paraphysoderma sedebokerense]|nr:Calreticulin family-domain-containing protein [Paraphysoderma sedebokerense]